MNPIIDDITEENGLLKFTLSGTNLSLANALRRTIISNIRTVVFRTTPYEENKCSIIVNTSRLNNEILKQRLSCIPIHITDPAFPIKDYIVEVNVSNNTDTIMYVTTGDFKIKNINTNEYLSEKDTREIFPRDEISGDFIDFVRLRQRISDEIRGEQLHFICELSVGTPKEDSMFNVASTCSYGYTLDVVAVDEELNKKSQKWKDEGKSKEEIDFLKKDWKLLEAQRITKKDSFDFIIETVGVFTNQDLIKLACRYLKDRLEKLKTVIETNEIQITPSVSTIKNCFDILLEDDDYTIGKCLEFAMYSKFFESVNSLTYCGYIKMHPHDPDSILRVSYKEEITDNSVVKQNMLECIEELKIVFDSIAKKF
uniref:DNA-directed RNA polymerase RpoA/D/Rpb3-type domain-containing protein n=1 Tax=viral metagenome TaxID=1070528 RepID=A0A6C0KXP5_9ZZZZ